MKKINFIFGIHNHQPVGNFESVLKWATEEAYQPFLDMLVKRQRIKFSLHITGYLFSWIKKNNQGLMDKIKKMVSKGQAELMTGGFYEPIMPSIPDRDKTGQIKKLTEFIKENFSTVPKGAWVAERVWEPHLVGIFGRTGIEYVALDDAHFKSAGLSEENLLGYYITEEQGESIKVFPISQHLRYAIPFDTPENVIEYFRSFASEDGSSLLVMADDGEKFGVWPKTHKHVYDDKWLSRFLDLLEKNSDWLNTTTFSEYMSNFPPVGRIYLPCASYFEMGEWSLPAQAYEEFQDVLKSVGEKPDGEKVRKFLKGGIWRNFLVKYPESNNMYRKMLRVSDKVGRMRSDAKTSAQDELWQGQCNCSYWHGIFGGLYLPHLRHGVYEHLIKAEKIADDEIYKGKNRFLMEKTDFSGDGSEEVLAGSPFFNLYFSPRNGGSVFELDYKTKNLNLLNVMTRRKEGYHKKLVEYLKNRDQKTEGIKTIHEMIEVKEEHLEDYLNYDWYRRSMLSDHFIHPSTKLDDFWKCKYGEQGDFMNQPFVLAAAKEGDGISLTFERSGSVWVENARTPVKVRKTVSFGDSPAISVDYRITNMSQAAVSLRFSPEFNFALSSPDGKDCYYYTESHKGELFSARNEISGIGKIGMHDAGFGIDILMTFGSPCILWRFPLETVSLSESGFERGYQQSVILPIWDLRLEPGGNWNVNIRMDFKAI